MSRPTNHIAAQVVVLFVAAGSLALAQAKKSSQPASSQASIWVSQTTHHVYRVERKGAAISAQWADVPPEDARHGAYVRTEFHRAGDKWIGITRSLLPCASGTSGSKPTVHWCRFVTHTEILTISPNRITGRAQAPLRGDCEQCKLLQTRWDNFVWSPQK
jgi:hypothetical protein